MISKYIDNANFDETGFSYTLSLISGKHKMVILYCLMEFEVVRFNELKRYLKSITDKTLSSNLCKVVDSKHIEYEGEIYSLSSFATMMVKSKHGVAGPRYFKYKGEWLNDIRDRLGV